MGQGTQHLLRVLPLVVGSLRGIGYWVPGGGLLGADLRSGLPCIAFFEVQESQGTLGSEGLLSV